MCFSERFVKVYYFESVSHHFNTPGGGVTIYYYLIQSEKSVCVLVVTTTSRDTTLTLLEEELLYTILRSEHTHNTVYNIMYYYIPALLKDGRREFQFHFRDLSTRTLYPEKGTAKEKLRRVLFVN